jgi:superfamily II DNA or RNA helicase
MNDAELTQWRSLSRRISTLRARTQTTADPDADRRIELLQFERARVVKGAEAKVPLAVEVLTAEYADDQRWIVYCDDLDQLEAVSLALRSAGIENLPYHSKMEGDKVETLRWLELRGGVVVAIKCLDEGVDIPSVSHALILASSKNPREFIQRRGRVLRKAPGKALAYIHDAIVIPAHDDTDGDDPIVAGELARAIEFGSHAANPAAMADLQQIAIDAGIDWQTALDWGIEDEDD